MLRDSSATRGIASCAGAAMLKHLRRPCCCDYSLCEACHQRGEPQSEHRQTPHMLVHLNC